MMKVLILDGSNNHSNWPTTSAIMNKLIAETGLFEVTLCRVQAQPIHFHADLSFFKEYDAIILNYTTHDQNLAGPIWPLETRLAFEHYMASGGGLVLIHSANNAFVQWDAFNQMAGIGGWGGRTRESGPYVYYDHKGMKVVDYTDPDRAGTDFASGYEFIVEVRQEEHPIMKDMPKCWRHTRDEVYERLRGPTADKIDILATAFSRIVSPGYLDATQRHEPIVITNEFGKGRVFHTTLGHASHSWQCVGLITLLQRGVEWAARGDVDQDLPSDFPTADELSYRKLEWPDLIVRDWGMYPRKEG